MRQATKAMFEKLKKRYGAPRLAAELRSEGLTCSVNAVAKLLSEEGLRARNGKGFKYSPAGVTKNNIAENLLGRCFKADEPNKKWVSDITYIPIRGGTVYLAVIMDLFS
ncbi:IS3 family transposase [Teredinibacter sp. KSP-S5-2]|uniref:IS3 family transposase n=1 Tax=Teredinibacter sp. KSP-S5-2 TaxID=3034506 RepID=UPI002934DBDE|nr:IS3 family transposase [Teredinibacter sp. KSP-S5-2]WNO10614.1 IS3 family transposase [Teredinibacter sp. KSP-S5-2]